MLPIRVVSGRSLLRIRHPEHTGNNLDLGDAVGVTKDNTDLGGGRALLRELADLLLDLVGSGLEPRRGGAGVGDGGGRNALALAVKTTHFDGVEYEPGDGLSGISKEEVEVESSQR